MNQNQQISENRKALPKFFLLLALSVLVGLVVGIVGAIAAHGGWQGSFRAALTRFFAAASPLCLALCCLVTLFAGLSSVRRGRAQLAALTDDDQSLRRADQTLSFGLSASGLAMPISFFFFGALFCCMEELTSLQFWFGLGGFAASLAASVIIQQKLVDLAKRLYPEKHGSVYDLKFQKIWYASCDEAERAVIAQAALRAYRVTGGLCLFLWVAFIVTQLVFQTGLLPIFTVSLIWLVSLAVYTSTAKKLERSGLQ